jgi:hypothetical protein
VALPAHVYQSEAWRLIAAELLTEIQRLQLANEALVPERIADRNRGGIVLARQLLRAAAEPATQFIPTPPDYTD